MNYRQLKSHNVTLALFATVVLAAAVGCADPAADKPQAEVGEAKAATNTSGGREFVTVAPSSIEWVGSKVTGSHDGGFQEFNGVINVVDGDPTRSSVTIDIAMDSIYSDSDRLTGHLKTDDFFAIETNPMAKFESTSIAANGDDYTVTGNLTLRGVTKSVTFPAQIEIADDRVTADAEFAIKRFDFGIMYAGRKDDLIRDDVVIRFNLVGEPA